MFHYRLTALVRDDRVLVRCSGFQDGRRLFMGKLVPYEGVETLERITQEAAEAMRSSSERSARRLSLQGSLIATE